MRIYPFHENIRTIIPVRRIHNREIMNLSEISGNILSLIPVIRTSLDLELQSISTCTSSMTDIETILDYENLCIICLSSNTNNNILLPCNHIFHIQCIIQWSITQITRKIKPSCPMCKINYDFNKFTKTILQKYINQIETIISQLDFLINNAKLSNKQKFFLTNLKKDYKRGLFLIKKEKDPINIIFLKREVTPLSNSIIQLIIETEQMLDQRVNATKNARSYNKISYLFKNPKFLYRYIVKFIRAI